MVFFAKEHARLSDELRALRLQGQHDMQLARLRKNLAETSNSGHASFCSPKPRHSSASDASTSASDHSPAERLCEPSSGRRPSAKGKGKGVAPPPQPPVSGRRASAEPAAQNEKRASKYVPLYWKASQEPEGLEKKLIENDRFICNVKGGIGHTVRDTHP